MVGAGGLMIILALAALVIGRKDKLANYKWFLRILSVSIALPYIANSAGWILAEMGRQPWIVYGLQTVNDGVSNIPASWVLISLIGFALVYTILMIVDVYLMAKFGIQEPSLNQEG